jgi:16S rRNA (cytosine1402-N4)-methyltransferase
MSQNNHHQPVLVAESMSYLAIKAGQYYLDATFGRGGHTQAILNRGGLVIALDFDQEAIEAGQENFKQAIADKQLILLKENFKNLQAVIDNLSKTQDVSLAGILFDFGTSTEQLTSRERGFSFSADENDILDMRMDQDLGVTAGELLIVLSEKQLSKVLAQYGGERDARQIAKAVNKVKKELPNSLKYSHTLLEIIEKVKGRKSGKLHPATKTFQALRIAVNDELHNIELALPAAFTVLQNSEALDKRLVCIAFHEGEDALVKRFFRQQSNQGLAKLLTKKPISANQEELKNNPRARSAKLRALVI